MKHLIIFIAASYYYNRIKKIPCIPFVILIFATSSFETIQAQRLILSGGAGIALGETIFLKKDMLCSEFLVGYEQIFNKGNAVSISFGQSAISFDYYDSSFNSVYNDRTFITVPIVFRKDFNCVTSSKKSFFYYGIGISGNLCYKDRKNIKNYQSSTTNVEKFTGVNLNICFEVGNRVLITEKSSLKLSLMTQIDFYKNYSSPLNKISLIKNIFIIAYSINSNASK